MCISPDELSNEQLETGIASLQQLIDENMYPHFSDFYQRRIELYEQLLKERAESGEYVNH